MACQCGCRLPTCSLLAPFPPLRPRLLDPEQLEMARTLLANPKLSTRQVAAPLGVHRATLYRSLGRGD